jgi:hypothetical protein
MLYVVMVIWDRACRRLRPRGERQAEASAEEATAQLPLPPFHERPEIIVEYRKTRAGWEKLLITNVGGRPAQDVEIGPLLSDGQIYPVTIMRVLPPILPGKPAEECEVVWEHARTHGQMALPDIIRQGTPASSDTVTVCYEDSDGRKFSRDFSLTRNYNDSVTWTPGPVRMRAAIQSVAARRTD